jgi:predicted RNase H-like HicB family nuclease
MKTLFDYQVVCRRDDNGSYVAYVPVLAGCHAIGPTPEEALSELRHVFDMIAEEFAEAGKPLPGDVQLNVVHARLATVRFPWVCLMWTKFLKT